MLLIFHLCCLIRREHDSHRDIVILYKRNIHQASRKYPHHFHVKISPFRAFSQNMQTHDENINNETRFCDNHRNVMIKEERCRKKIDGIFVADHDTTRMCGGQGHWYTSRLASLRRSCTESPHAKHTISLVSEKKFYECLLERSRGMRATETNEAGEDEEKKR